MAVRLINAKGHHALFADNYFLLVLLPMTLFPLSASKRKWGGRGKAGDENGTRRRQ
jgi:hypothetical protein